MLSFSLLLSCLAVNATLDLGGKTLISHGPIADKHIRLHGQSIDVANATADIIEVKGPGKMSDCLARQECHFYERSDIKNSKLGNVFIHSTARFENCDLKDLTVVDHGKKLCIELINVTLSGRISYDRDLVELIVREVEQPTAHINAAAA